MNKTNSMEESSNTFLLHKANMFLKYHKNWEYASHAKGEAYRLAKNVRQMCSKTASESLCAQSYAMWKSYIKYAGLNKHAQ